MFVPTLKHSIIIFFCSAIWYVNAQDVDNKASSKTQTTNSASTTIDFYEPLWCKNTNNKLPLIPTLAPDTITASADSLIYQNQSIHLNNNVQLLQNGQILSSKSAQLDKKSSTAYLHGSFNLYQKNKHFLGNNAVFQWKTKELEINNLQYTMAKQHIRGSGKRLIQDKQGVIYIDHATYTTCPIGINSWQLISNKLILNSNTGIGKAYNAKLKIADIPVLLIPYLEFPLDKRRRSGFLNQLKLKSNDTLGIQFGLPYYWNIAPNHDITFIPQYMSKRGLFFENEFRYLHKKGNGSINFNLLPIDLFKKNNQNYNKTRWYIHTKNSYHFSKNWHLNINYSNTSDKNYLKEFGSSHEQRNTQLLSQTISTNYHRKTQFNNWSFNAKLNKFKPMNQSSNIPYNQLPHLSFKGYSNLGNNTKIHYLIDYSNFKRPKNWHSSPISSNFSYSSIPQPLYDNGFGLQKATGSRLYGELVIDYLLHQSWFTLNPAVKFRANQYHIHNTIASEVISDIKNAYLNPNINHFTNTPSSFMPTLSVDGKLYFDRFFQNDKKTFKQTIEPKLKYVYSPYVQDQEFNPIYDSSHLNFNYENLWKDSDFTGYDRLSNTNHLAVGITSRILENDNGAQLLQFSLGQRFYFSNRHVYISNSLGYQSTPTAQILKSTQQLRDRLKKRQSDIASILEYQFSPLSKLKQEIVWNPTKNHINHYLLNYQFSLDYNKIFNARFEYSKNNQGYQNNLNIPVLNQDEIKVTDLSFVWPLLNKKNIVIIGRWQYDITNKNNITKILGFEYSSCCYKFQLYWNSHMVLDHNNFTKTSYNSGIYVQFTLKGFGDSNDYSTNQYQQAILGYTLHEK